MITQESNVIYDRLSVIYLTCACMFDAEVPYVSQPTDDKTKAKFQSLAAGIEDEFSVEALADARKNICLDALCPDACLRIVMLLASCLIPCDKRVW